MSGPDPKPDKHGGSAGSGPGRNSARRLSARPELARLPVLEKCNGTPGTVPTGGIKKWNAPKDIVSTRGIKKMRSSCIVSM